LGVLEKENPKCVVKKQHLCYIKKPVDASKASSSYLYLSQLINVSCQMVRKLIFPKLMKMLLVNSKAKFGDYGMHYSSQLASSRKISLLIQLKKNKVAISVNLSLPDSKVQLDRALSYSTDYLILQQDNKAIWIYLMLCLLFSVLILVKTLLTI